MAEHSFQEPMPNSLLLLSYLFFGARFYDYFAECEIGVKWDLTHRSAKRVCIYQDSDKEAFDFARLTTVDITGCLPFLTLQLFQAARPLVIYFFNIGIIFL